MNYFLGLDPDASNNYRLVADFEDTATGANHPVFNASGTVIPPNTWTHVAATSDGNEWRLYVNGNLEVAETEGATPRFDSVQHFGIGSAMTDAGAAAGFFQGRIDEVRVWNIARSQAQIQASMNSPITTATAGLLARYGLNEGTGAAVGDSIAPAQNGTTQPAANLPSWAAGAPALDGDVTAPAAPSGLAATAGEGNVALNWNDNGEGDLAGYNVYRGTSSPVSTAGTPLNGGSRWSPRNTTT